MIHAKQRIIYLSGPMTGLPASNYPLFNQVAAELRGKDHVVFNPAEFAPGVEPFPLRQAFAEYCRFICLEACTIALLPNWHKSNGATIERNLARTCGLDAFRLIEDDIWVLEP